MIDLEEIRFGGFYKANGMIRIGNQTEIYFV